MKRQEIQAIVDKIVELNQWLSEFWSNSFGWAPKDAATLMSNSRLDRQSSLSKCLYVWISIASYKIDDGHLILAWANLGSLIEGTLKLFLSAYYDDYRKDIDAFKDKYGDLIDPDCLALDRIRIFFNKANLWSKKWDDFTLKVQQYRNAIHAFKDRDLGSFKEFCESVNTYLNMIREFNLCLPYPDEVYVPK